MKPCMVLEDCILEEVISEEETSANTLGANEGCPACRMCAPGPHGPGETMHRDESYAQKAW